MSKTNKTIIYLNTILNDLKSLNTSTVDKSYINSIKQKIYNASKGIDLLASNSKQLIEIESIIKQSLDILHKINTSKYINDYNIKDIYADLSANVYYLKEQVERIKNY